MSFSADVKKELAQTPLDNFCCIQNELSAITQTSATLILKGRESFELKYILPNTALARRVFLLLRNGFKISPALQFITQTRFKHKKIATLVLDKKDALILFNAFGMLKGSGNNSTKLLRIFIKSSPSKKCCRSAFIKGAFLSSGSITNPEKSYHLEIRTHTKNFHSNLFDTMVKSGLNPKSTLRNNKKLIYIKNSEDIINFLAISGAHNALFKMEDIRIRKGILNQVNRTINCDNSNLNKQLQAAQTHINAINQIDQNLSLTSLSKPLQEIAYARLNHPEISLNALGELLDPPIKKSSVNYRLQKLMTLAAQIKENKKGDIL